MAHVKNHDYHILPPSLWPFLGAVSAFVMLTGLALFELSRRQYMIEWGEIQTEIEKEIKRRETAV